LDGTIARAFEVPDVEEPHRLHADTATTANPSATALRAKPEVRLMKS